MRGALGVFPRHMGSLGPIWYFLWYVGLLEEDPYARPDNGHGLRGMPSLGADKGP